MLIIISTIFSSQISVELLLCLETLCATICFVIATDTKMESTWCGGRIAFMSQELNECNQASSNLPGYVIKPSHVCHDDEREFRLLGV